MSDLCLKKCVWFDSFWWSWFKKWFSDSDFDSIFWFLATAIWWFLSKKRWPSQSVPQTWLLHATKFHQTWWSFQNRLKSSWQKGDVSISKWYSNSRTYVDCLGPYSSLTIWVWIDNWPSGPAHWQIFYFVQN